MYKTASQNGCANGQRYSAQIVAFGNPLLDVSVKLTDNSVLLEFNLKPDDQQEIPMDVLIRIMTTLIEREYPRDYNAGGSALNTCRILKKLNHNILFFGGIGNDENGVILQNMLTKSGVKTCLQKSDDFHTGTCICLISNDKRSLNANIGAALYFDQQHLETSEVFNEITCADRTLSGVDSGRPGVIFYVEGFFIPNKLSVCKYIYDEYCKMDEYNLFVTNLNASYIIKQNSNAVKYLTECADIIFGNRKEYLALVEAYKMESLKILVDYLIEKFVRDRDKILVVTNGNQPVHLYYGHGHNVTFTEIIPETIPLDKVQDTTGAGDSFVSGFLSAYLRQDSLIDCVRNGCKLSARVIQNIGCNL